ncbi:4-hydroxybenzoate octaprenyltransferase [Anaplasmataceae bacterium AB001_6]|nr:4-hydroxybenzoate octaprenyltransferase [Anaplasmataceae bacterium AB001_6]
MNDTKLFDSRKKIINYLNLIRFFNPVGTLLVFFPCLFQLFNLYCEIENFLLWFGFFLIGSFVARSAGCIINDIADRNIDINVERTKERVLVIKEVSIKEALFLMILLSAMGLGMLFFIGLKALLMGLLIGIGIICYPFVKRFFDYPQIFLGFIFNSGALFVTLAILGEITFQSVLLYIGCILWTIFYDTIYAHQDKIYDKELGLKSMALTTLGSNLDSLIKIFNLAILFWMISLLKFSDSVILLVPIAAILSFLHKRYVFAYLNIENPKSCSHYFTLTAYCIGPIISLLFLFSSL